MTIIQLNGPHQGPTTVESAHVVVESVECANCLEVIERDVQELDGECMCEDCFGDLARECECCGMFTRSDDMILVQNLDWCQGCFERRGGICCRCGDALDSDDCPYVDEEPACDRCRDNYASYCDTCDSTSWEPHEHQRDGLLDYSYKPVPIFHDVVPGGSSKSLTPRPGGLYLGLELEIESGGESIGLAVERLAARFGDSFYAKHDGSLSDGLEVVGHPMSLDYWQGIAEEFGAFLDVLRRDGYRSWDPGTCGIHVHVSAAAFSSFTHRLAFCQLFYKNAEEWQRLAGRRESSWASFEEGSGVVFKNLKDVKKSDSGSGRRYVAVNLSNTHTLEVRIFRGTLNPARVMADLELVAAAVEYTRTLSAGDAVRGGLRFNRFSSWMRESFIPVLDGKKASLLTYHSAVSLLNAKGL